MVLHGLLNQKWIKTRTNGGRLWISVMRIFLTPRAASGRPSLEGLTPPAPNMDIREATPALAEHVNDMAAFHRAGRAPQENLQ